MAGYLLDILKNLIKNKKENEKLQENILKIYNKSGKVYSAFKVYKESENLLKEDFTTIKIVESKKFRLSHSAKGCPMTMLV